ncbi:hypothetical protein NEUTE1DRAFT_118883 [Neurospora tetrasperma FGSC 2508]|uniref:Uncharacterized protein n=1 Tax=Neurospora tetrasperma (strain FGSC 2508 / ATCC MYA-4615 / P0657) TaxID=510951 RepID=F8N4E0_NEUT8|nr:uncharacterized protein NEUTE1DRAFT_118883 [Neurospora tetrasperma FGSC 2508]EGO52681.1 hypothetical protein NEUTE1DRAFT_118883 [Neurospora tetrasperma FGSC 2508]
MYSQTWESLKPTILHQRPRQFFPDRIFSSSGSGRELPFCAHMEPSGISPERLQIEQRPLQ